METAASIIAFVQLAEKVISGCKYIIETVKDAPSDMLMIYGEITSLKALTDIFSTTAPLPKEHAQTLKSCHTALQDLAALLPPNDELEELAQSSPLSKSFRVSWVFKQSKARKILANLAQQKSTVLLAITSSVGEDVRDVKAGVKRLEDSLQEHERENIRDWLEQQTFNPSSKHWASTGLHEPETTRWLFRSPEWTKWLAGAAATRFVWVNGIPGAGKTILASRVIEEVRDSCGQKPKIGWAYYYCLFSHERNEAPCFLSWVVSRLSKQAGFVPDLVRKMWTSKEEIPWKRLLQDALLQLLSSFERVYLILDAIDESLARDDILTVLATIATDDRYAKIQLLATSRLYVDIETAVRGICTPLSMSNPEVEKDIAIYVHHELRNRRRLKRWAEIHDEIEHAVATGAKGMFRWAECQLAMLEKQVSQEDLLDALKDLPEDLDAMYLRIFEGVPAEHAEILKLSLLWIMGSDALKPNPGSMSVVRHFTHLQASIWLQGVIFSTPGLGNPGKSTLDLKFLRELCSCLVRTTKSPNTDDLIVALAHYTVREFLESPRIRQSTASQFAITTDKVEVHAYHLVYSVLNGISDPGRMSSLESHCSTIVEASHINEHVWPNSVREAALNRDSGYLWKEVSKFYVETLPRWAPFLDARDTSIHRVIFLKTHIDEACVMLLSLLGPHLRILDRLDTCLGLNIAMTFIDTLDVTESLDYSDSHSAEAYRGTIVEILCQQLQCPSHVTGALLDKYLRLTEPAPHPNREFLFGAIFHHRGIHPKFCDATRCLASELVPRFPDINLTGFFATPLQIATANCDVAGARVLLEAGADPNGVGPEDGRGQLQEVYALGSWTDGKRPLRIAREMDKRFAELGRVEDWKALETLLLHHGAKD